MTNIRSGHFLPEEGRIPPFKICQPLTADDIEILAQKGFTMEQLALMAIR